MEYEMEDIIFNIECKNKSIKNWCDNIMKQFVVNLYESMPRGTKYNYAYTIYIYEKNANSKTKLHENEFIIFEHFNNKKSIRLQLFQIADLCIKHLV